MPNDVRTCGQNCECYDSQDPQKGNCRLYGALINLDQRKRFKEIVYGGELCKYGLAVDEETPRTPQQFLFVLHNKADPFLTFPSPRVVSLSDIDPNVLTGLAQKAQSQLQSQH